MNGMIPLWSFNIQSPVAKSIPTLLYVYRVPVQSGFSVQVLSLYLGVF